MSIPEAAGGLSERVAATQKLTIQAERLFEEHTSLVTVASYGYRDRKPVDVLAVAIPYQGHVDYPKTHTTDRLEPGRVERYVTDEGETEYSFIVGPPLVATQVSWSSGPNSAAQLELSGIGEQLEGRYHDLDLDRIESALDKLSLGIPYSANRVIVKGLYKDRIMGKGVLGKIGRFGIGVRKVLGGNLEPLTH